MIPYFTFQTIPLGPIHIQVWGLFVALGICLGLWIGWRQALRHGLDGAAFMDMAAWALLAAVIGSRLLYVLAYDPWTFIDSPLSAFRLWDGGMSAFGGFIGAGAAIWIFCRRGGLPFLNYANAAAFGLPWGYAVGRIGCFLIHDHVGIASNVFFAVNFPGAAKLDLGLFHVLFGLLLGIGFLVAEYRFKGKPVPYLFLFMVIYGLGRLGLDFLRYWDPPFADQRYLGLTPAQYLSVPAVLIGIWFLVNPPRLSWWQKLTGLIRRLVPCRKDGCHCRCREALGRLGAFFQKFGRRRP